MLKKLIIKDFALIEDMSINFNDGLTALTGETGAGKSIILESLQLLFGKRSDSQMIRHGKSKASVFASFKLTDEKALMLGLPNEIEVLRVIDENGRNTIKINDDTITLQKLRDIMLEVGSIHSQNDTLQLLDKETYLSFIDELDQKSIEPIYNEYLINRSHYLELKKQLKTSEKQKATEEEQMSFFEFQLKELTSLNLLPNEKDILDEKIEKLKHHDKTLQALKNALAALDNDYLKTEYIYDASKSLQPISFLDETYSKSQEKLMDIYYELDEVKKDLKYALESLDFNAVEFDQMQSRSHELSKIELKYQKSVNELIEYQESLENKLLMVKNYDAYLEKLEKEIKIAFDKTYEKASKLTKLRQKLSRELEAKIVSILKDLDLEKTAFKVVFEEVEKHDDMFLEKGIDNIDFHISLNEGEPIKPLSKVASGGEKARFMLALKSIYAENRKLSTLILDEIDTGISGKTASKVANKMKELSDNMQVLVITHLPQVAAKANEHYGIYKRLLNGRMVTEIDILDMESRITSIATMLSDDKLSPFAIEQAKMLLKK